MYTHAQSTSVQELHLTQAHIASDLMFTASLCISIAEAQTHVPFVPAPHW